jgi:hypothetical protein
MSFVGAGRDEDLIWGIISSAEPNWTKGGNCEEEDFCNRGSDSGHGIHRPDGIGKDP